MTSNLGSAIGELSARVKFLEAELELSIAAHKWWLVAGLVAGLIFGALIGLIL